MHLVIKEKNKVRINRLFDWLIHMIGYTIVFIAVIITPNQAGSVMKSQNLSIYYINFARNSLRASLIWVSRLTMRSIITSGAS